MTQYLMQATSDDDSSLQSWLVANAPDFAAANFPGPGSAVAGSVAVVAKQPANEVGAWVNFTPTIDAAGGSFALGNGTSDGYYRYIGTNSIQVNLQFLFGSTTNAGTGALRWTLPASLSMDGSAFPAGGIVDLPIDGQGVIQDADLATNNKILSVFRAGADTKIEIVPSGSITPVSGTAPFTLAAGDNIAIQFTIPVGSA